MTTLVLGAVGGIVSLAVLAAAGFAITDATRVIRAYVRARQGTHRPTPAAWRMCHGSPRVPRTSPAWSHRKRRVAA